MAQIIEQSDKFGKIGKAFGEGMGQQLPKEVDRYRLSQGLQKFEQESPNLNPMQQLARLSAIPGITPQMIQSFSELAKQQGVRNAFKGGVTRGSISTEAGPGQNKSAVEDLIPYQAQKSKPVSQTKGENVSPQDFGQPQIVENNPLRPEAIPAKPWNAERRNAEIADIFDRFPQMTLPEATQLAADNEARALAQPEAEQKRDTYLKGVQQEASDKFTKQLETKLGKKIGADNSISGEMYVNLQRGMEKELRTNPNASVDDVVNKWTQKGLDLDKAKGQLEKLAETTGLENFLNKDKTLAKLEAYQKIYNAAGNKEEYQKTLISKMGMSPQGAASVAYPMTKNVADYVKKSKPIQLFSAKNIDQVSRQRANDLEKLITSDDSILSIARDMRRKDKFFNETAFFKQLADDLDDIALTPRQRQEVGEGASGILPVWGDLFYLPLIE